MIDPAMKLCVANSKVCGSPMFERQVRAALRNSPHDIKLITSSFHIDENTSSRTASFRSAMSQGRRGKAQRVFEDEPIHAKNCSSNTSESNIIPVQTYNPTPTRFGKRNCLLPCSKISFEILPTKKSRLLTGRIAQEVSSCLQKAGDPLWYRGGLAQHHRRSSKSRNDDVACSSCGELQDVFYKPFEILVSVRLP